MNLLTINSGEGYSLLIVACDTRTCARIGGILVCAECDAFRSFAKFQCEGKNVHKYCVLCINTVYYARYICRCAAFNEQTVAA